MIVTDKCVLSYKLRLKSSFQGLQTNYLGETGKGSVSKLLHTFIRAEKKETTKKKINK